MNTKTLISRISAIIAAIILLQTLYFKFTAHPDSVYIFSTLGVEPYGRIGLGIMELIAGVLLIVPRTTVIGALLALGLIFGAVASHLFILGIEVQNDGGALFMLALAVLATSAITIILRKDELLELKKKIM